MRPGILAKGLGGTILRALFPAHFAQVLSYFRPASFALKENPEISILPECPSFP
jgi:hypothetical protein